MSYLLILLSVAFLGAVCECLAVGHKRLQEQIYYLSFALVAAWCTAKYAYGPDIYSYYPFFESLRNPFTDVLSPDQYFESGFVFFCSALKCMGLTFWGMTAVVSVLYFTAIGLLWRQLHSYKTIGLLGLVALDYNLILVEYRQCLAVSFFIFAVLLLQKKRYIWAVVCVLISVTMHKSSLIIMGCVALLWLFRRVPVGKRGYLLLAGMITLLAFVPLQPLLTKIVSVLPIGEKMSDSIEHHLLIGKTFQRVFLLYALTLLCLAYYKRDTASNKPLHWLLWCSAAVLVCLYPYWFLLNRLRSYFLPFLIVYIINTLCAEEQKNVLFRQVYTCFIMLYFGVFALSLPRQMRTLRYSTDRVSLVTERFKHTEKELMNRQLRQAELYWKIDYKELLDKGMTQ